jgi:predicted RNA-binding protein with PUA domain
MSFWKTLMGRRSARAEHRAEEVQLETPAERRFASEGVDAVAADEVVEEQLGGVSPDRLVDDEFKP